MTWRSSLCTPLACIHSAVMIGITSLNIWVCISLCLLLCLSAVPPGEMWDNRARSRLVLVRMAETLSRDARRRRARDAFWILSVTIVPSGVDGSGLGAEQVRSQPSQSAARLIISITDWGWISAVMPLCMLEFVWAPAVCFVMNFYDAKIPLLFRLKKNSLKYGSPFSVPFIYFWLRQNWTFLRCAVLNTEKC